MKQTLVVLETLTPAERLAFVLHDMFAVPFDEIAPVVNRSPQAARQLASRARQRVRGADPAPSPDQARQRRVVDAFLAAARAGDFDGLVEVLDPDVVFRRRGVPGPALLTGAAAVAGQAVEQGPRFARRCRQALVNGAPGVLVQGTTGPIGAAAVTVVSGRIVAIDLVVDPRRFRTARRRANEGRPR